jgi:adenosylhomocysteine nucleosidase
MNVPSRNKPSLRARSWFALPALVILVVGVLFLPGVGHSGASAAPTRSAATAAPIGIVDAFGVEQAPILAEMNVTSHVDIDGYRFWVGTIDGQPVVDVASGEVDETAELATYILDTTFHPRATLFSGTAGAQNAAVHVGDVVLSGFVVNKTSTHYYLGGYQDGYTGAEIRVTKASDLRGDTVTGYGTPLPTPGTAKTYGYGPPTLTKSWVDVGAYAAPKQLVTVGEGASTLLGTTAIADATGNPKRTGTITNEVVAGVIGEGDVWTEPLSWIEAQNMLYQTDAEENEGSGFAFANSQLGVPWLLVRGISDSVWYPKAYDGIISSQHAAIVVRYIVDHLPAFVSKAPMTIGDLWPTANAVTAGYLIAKRAYYTVSTVGRVTYVNGKGKTVSLTGPALSQVEQEYTYAAGKIG